MGELLVILIFLLDVVVVWQLLNSSLPVNKLYLYILLVVILPILGVIIYHFTEIMVSHKKQQDFEP